MSITTWRVWQENVDVRYNRFNNVLRFNLGPVYFYGSGEGEGGVPSLTDVYVVLYLLFTECSNCPFQGGCQVLGAVGVRVGVGCGGPNPYS